MSEPVPDAPELSVVIASVNGLPHPLDCLDALAAQEPARVIEVIVADASGPTTVAAIRARHPWVRVLEFPSATSIPDLRAAGVAAATAHVVAVTEDHCVPRPDWCAQLLAALERTGWTAVGGGVENMETDRPVDWAVYFCEYHGLISPVREGPAEGIPGMNVAYDLDRAGAARGALTEGLWENVIHDRLRAAGCVIGLDPAVVVEHRKRFTVPMFLAERFHYSRAYAGERVRGAPLSTRLAYAAGGLLLPPLLVARIVRAVAVRRRHVRRLLRALPLVVLFSVVWACGESIGYLIGPGDSVLRIR